MAFIILLNIIYQSIVIFFYQNPHKHISSPITRNSNSYGVFDMCHTACFCQIQFPVDQFAI